jgi:hypothetical protein
MGRNPCVKPQSSRRALSRRVGRDQHRSLVHPHSGNRQCPIPKPPVSGLGINPLRPRLLRQVHPPITSLKHLCAQYRSLIGQQRRTPPLTPTALVRPRGHSPRRQGSRPVISDQRPSGKPCPIEDLCLLSAELLARAKGAMSGVPPDLSPTAPCQ